MDSEQNLQLNLTTNTASAPVKRKLDTKNDSTEPEPIKKKKNKEANSAKKPEVQGEFISSLFNNNPEIPKLELDSGESSKKEAVFSSKALEDGGVHPYIAQTLRNLGMYYLIKLMIFYSVCK